MSDQNFDSSAVCESCERPFEPSILGSVCPVCLLDSLDIGSVLTWTREQWRPPALPDLQTSIGQAFEIREFLGRGGMGAVYRAIQPALGDRSVAIKCLPKELSESPSFARLFRREAAVLANLRHPNIVTVHDFDKTADGYLYFVMELIEGTDLHRLRQKEDLKTSHIISLMNQIFGAVEYIHGQGYAHRDIKPSNIFLDSDGTAKLGDFGLSMLLSEIASDRSGEQQHQHGLSFVIGTPGYAAPEQSFGKDNLKSDHRADIYSLGVTLRELLRDKPSEKMNAEDLRLRKIVEKATAVEPDERYSSIAEFRKALNPRDARFLLSFRILFATVFLLAIGMLSIAGLLRHERLKRNSPSPAVVSRMETGEQLTRADAVSVAEQTFPLPYMSRPTLTGRVRTWRHNLFEDIHQEANIPPFENIVQVSANCYPLFEGTGHVLVLTADGVVHAWGGNGDGQLNVPNDLPPIARVLAGRRFSAAVSENGTLYAWGAMKKLGDISVFQENVAEVTPTTYGMIILQVNGKVSMLGVKGSEDYHLNRLPGAYSLSGGDWERGGWFVALADGRTAHNHSPHEKPLFFPPPRDWVELYKIKYLYALSSTGSVLTWRGKTFKWQPIAENVRKMRAVDNLGKTNGGAIWMERNLVWTGPGIQFLDNAKRADQQSFGDFLSGAIDVTFGRCHAFALFPDDRDIAIQAIEGEWRKLLKRRQLDGVISKPEAQKP